ncbi:type II secretion system protein [Thiomicrorhabdus lithotrophica]|uniref:Type II secretion system GspH family protein n=1 Tax=Thiomicrorhabdus lithotrophica TaxID=2949997 RepID=A0ABY8C8G8_9GAMM|nr:type II secretion system protein [Thiomicrorhabdus lithotrophica]WEJ62259.1 type II secretion system GspH family protein [Thiomicrorhabdus lithotrophica]
MNRQVKQNGFSVVELAIVLGIIGIVFVGAISGLGEHRSTAKQLESQKNQANIKDQLIKFAVINKYLPCPDTDGDGAENRVLATVAGASVNVCSADNGTVPYVDIGMKRADAQDAYGNFIRYAINRDADDAVSGVICNNTSSASFFCNSTPGTAIFNMTLTPPVSGDRGVGNYYICNENTNTCSGTPAPNNLVSDSAVVVLVAYNEDGASTLAACGSATGANAENCDIDDYYHQQQLTSASGSFFDDTILSISGYEIKSEILSPVIVWSNATATTPLTPTYQGYDLNAGSYTPLDDPANPDVIYVDHNVTTALDLGQGDDYLMIGGNLSSELEYNNETGVITNDGSNAALDTGEGNDTVYISNSANSDITLGDGDDIFVIGADLTKALSADDGNDQVWVRGDVVAGSNLNLGAGDDVLWVGDSANPSSGNIKQFITGGDGVDILVLENFASAADFWTASPPQFFNVAGFEYIIFADDGSGTRSHCEVGVSCP